MQTPRNPATTEAPANASENLISHGGAAGDETESIEGAACAEIGEQRAKVERVTTLAEDLDVLDASVFADDELQDAIALIFQSAGPSWLSIKVALAPAPTTISERV